MMPEPGIDATEKRIPANAEAHLEALIQSSDDPIWSVDLDFGIITVNEASQRILESGLGFKAFVGARPEDLVSPAEAAIWNGFYKRALAEGSLRVEHVLPSGRTLEMTFSRIVAGGEVLGISGLGKDITGRKQAERALLQAERKYRDIFDGALEGIFQTYSEGGVATVNDSLARMLGYASADEFISLVRDISNDVWEDPKERIRCLRRIEEEGSIHGFECQFKRKDGSTIWIWLSARKVMGEHGKPPYIEGFIEDITPKKLTEKLLSDSEERYRATFEQAAVGILHTSFDGRIIRCNERFGEIVGYSPGEIRGKAFQELTAPEDRARSMDALQEQVSGASSSARFEKRYIRKDGSLTWVALTTSVMRDGQGHPLHFIALAEDINARKRAEEQLAAAQEALRANEERYRTTFQMSLDAVNINRLSDGVYVMCNNAFLDITGYAREDVLGRSSLELDVWAKPTDRMRLVEILKRKSICRNFEAQFKKRNGDTFYGLMSASLIELDGNRCVLSVTRDISDAKTAEEEIRNLAFYDPLTHLPNRRLLLERLPRTLGSAAGSRGGLGRKRALLFVDLDNFKMLNDTLGHNTGDLMLQEVARRLTRCVRETDSVARFGGDEFVVMLEDLSESSEEAATQARIVGEKILTALGEPCQLAGHECISTSSVGITVFGDKNENISEIMKQADIAMYQAKASGRNTIRFFAPELQATVNARAVLESDLRQGIKTGQFALWYQPQIVRGLVVGAEALIRWNHPSRGCLAPDCFIPLAEETGQIVPLGNWVLEAACAQIAVWACREETAHLSLAINISALQFRQPDFVDQVLATLDRFGAKSERLRLELTESMLVYDVEQVIAKMAQLKSSGVRLSLDDFGTGYSSLAYLKRLPLDQLKIDRTFVRDILENATSRAIAQAVVTLGQAMNISVIAEGVENDQQRLALADVGCHAYQGYLFSPPLPLSEFHLCIPRLAA